MLQATAAPPLDFFVNVAQVRMKQHFPISLYDFLRETQSLLPLFFQDVDLDLNKVRSRARLIYVPHRTTEDIEKPSRFGDALQSRQCD